MLRRLFLLFLMMILMLACGEEEEVLLTCDEQVPAEDASFSKVYSVLSSTCGFVGCHDSESQLYGYDFSTRAAAYHSFTRKPEIVFAQIASGQMPLGLGPLGEAQVRMIETWYCNGAIYESESESE